MKRTLSLTFMWLDLCLQGLAEETPDFQLRIPFHLQYKDLHTNSWGSFGWAAWSIFPDAMAKNNESATLHLFGPLWNYGSKGSWVELMGGTKRNTDGYFDPLVDMRLADRTLPHVNFYTELAYFTRAETRRVYVWAGMDTPFTLRSYAARVGFESENVISYSGKNDSLGIGPRLVLPLFMGKKIPGLSSTLITTYQFHNQGDYVRCYLVFTYAVGKK